MVAAHIYMPLHTRPLLHSFMHSPGDISIIFRANHLMEAMHRGVRARSSMSAHPKTLLDAPCRLVMSCGRGGK